MDSKHKILNTLTLKVPLNRTKLDSLTGLRFYLAMFVFFHHGIVQAHLELGKQALNPKLLDALHYTFNGAFAVSTFFVLSGFVMWYSYSERTWTITEFLGNRFARLFPVYLLGILIVLLRWNKLVAEFCVTNVEAIKRLALSTLMLQSWGFDWRATQMFNGPGWTLSVEMFFYVTFPLLFWIHKKSERWFLVTCTSIVILTIPNSILRFSEDLPFCIQHWGYFCLGLLLARAWQVGLRFNVNTVPVALLLTFGLNLSRFINGNIISLLVPALIIGSLATADMNERSSPLFSNKWIVLGGEISYALYILHAPIQTIVYSIFFRSGIFLLHVDNIKLKIAYVAICLIATLFASYLTWRFIEIPARRQIVNWLKSSTA
jgi:peptidoglycan/LPS O-acetylase OafA/YrhL